MISARRLAREWALKILYQSDVGRMSIAESQAVALERLRMEFVRRASRSAQGSILEEKLADGVTEQLRELLPDFDSSMERTLHECFARIADAGDYWSKVTVDLSVSRQSFNALWEIPNKQAELALPVSGRSLLSHPASESNVEAVQRDWAETFLDWARTSLPTVAMAAYAVEVRNGRPSGAKLKETHEYVVNKWRVFGTSIEERWRPTISAIEQHASDWLRVAAFTLKLVEGVSENREAIDRSLESHEIGWSLNRQVSVDRNILRMAAFELHYMESIPASATINEAVELAKKYSTAESGKFVNGVLGAIVAAEAVSSQSTDPDDLVIDLRDDEVDSLVDADEVVKEELAHV